MVSEWIQRGARYVGTTALALALFFAGVEAAHAQEGPTPEASDTVISTEPTLGYGIRLGVGITGVQGDAVARENRGSNPLVGAFLTYPMTNWLAVQPEAAYRLHTVEVASAEQRPPQLWRHTTHYLDIPVLFKGYLPAPEDTRLYLHAGPDLALALSSETDLAESRTDDLPPAFGEDFNTVNVGAVVGGGVDRFIDGRLFSVDVRYVLGLTDLVTQSDAPSLYNQSFDITVGIGL